MKWNNRITQILKIKYPFIQAPMLNFTTPQMVAAAADSKIMGSLPLGLMSVEKATEAITAVKKITGAPFSVNVFVYPKTNVPPDASLTLLKMYYEKSDLPFPGLPGNDPYTSYEELMDVIIAERIPAVSFAFGIPAKYIIDKLKERAVTLIGVATCVEEAKKIQDHGLDIIIAQGLEAGGHRGTFIEGDLPQVGLISLLPQVIDAVNIPVIAAGGLSQGKSIAAAFILGAEGVQIGSAFLRSRESAASDIHKKLIGSLKDTDTTITNAWTGRFARMISNDFIKQSPPEDILPYPYQNYMSASLRQYGKKQNLSETQALYAGQSAKYASGDSTAEITMKLISEAEDTLENAHRIFN